MTIFRNGWQAERDIDVSPLRVQLRYEVMMLTARFLSAALLRGAVFLWPLAIVNAESTVPSIVRAEMPREVTKEFFGLHIHQGTQPRVWPRIPFGSWRLWDAHVSWPHLQPGPRTWNFDLLDLYVQKASDEDIELVLPFGLSPRWASARQAEPSAYKQLGWAAEPQNIGVWRDYVEMVASRYKGKIRYYEIWNEPNLSRFFSGDVRAMVVLACNAHEVIKRVDPEAKVVSPSATNKDAGLGWLSSYFEAGGDKCADIVGFHFYTWAHDPPEEIARLSQEVRNVMNAYGLGSMPLWNTESGWYVANSRVSTKTKYKVLSDHEASAYIVRALTLAAASGMGRFFWYAWDNQTMGGLIEPDTKDLKSAAHAYALAVKWLQGATVTECTREGNLWTCLIRKEEKVGRIVWSEKGSSRVNISGLRGARVIHFSNVGSDSFTSLVPSDGSITVDGSPVLLTDSSSW